mmetsp:Transcript_22149/g.50115  ORF Transcript_22149/g.50115 Transcript_22149/m.50115 type:complete len:254 (-) Transcript_22149:416-1177(-)
MLAGKKRRITSSAFKFASACFSINALVSAAFSARYSGWLLMIRSHFSYCCPVSMVSSPCMSLRLSSRIFFFTVSRSLFEGEWCAAPDASSLVAPSITEELYSMMALSLRISDRATTNSSRSKRSSLAATCSSCSRSLSRASIALGVCSGLPSPPPSLLASGLFNSSAGHLEEVLSLVKLEVNSCPLAAFSFPSSVLLPSSAGSEEGLVATRRAAEAVLAFVVACSQALLRVTSWALSLPRATSLSRSCSDMIA